MDDREESGTVCRVTGQNQIQPFWWMSGHSQTLHGGRQGRVRFCMVGDSAIKSALWVFDIEISDSAQWVTKQNQTQHHWWVTGQSETLHYR